MVSRALGGGLYKPVVFGYPLSDLETDAQRATSFKKQVHMNMKK